MSDESFILVEFPASLNVLIDVTHHYPPVLIVRYGGLRYDFVSCKPAATLLLYSHFPVVVRLYSLYNPLLRNNNGLHYGG